MSRRFAFSVFAQEEQKQQIEIEIPKIETPNKQALYHHIDTDGYFGKFLFGLKNPKTKTFQYDGELNPPKWSTFDELVFIDTAPPFNFVRRCDKKITIFDHHSRIHERIQGYVKDYHYSDKICGSKIYYDANPDIHSEYLDHLVDLVNQYDIYEFHGDAMEAVYLNEYVMKYKKILYKPDVADRNTELAQMLSIGKQLYDSREGPTIDSIKTGVPKTIMDKKVLLVKDKRIDYQFETLYKKVFPEVEYLINTTQDDMGVKVLIIGKDAASFEKMFGPRLFGPDFYAKWYLKQNYEVLVQ